MPKKHLNILLTLLGSLCLVAPVGADSPLDYDASFAQTGSEMVWMQEYQFAQDVVTDAIGNVYIALVISDSASATGYRPAVMKLALDGDLVTDFGTDGIFVIPKDFPSTEIHNSCVDIAIDSDGKILISYPGEGGSPSSWNFFVARVFSSGSALDGSFGFLGTTVAAFDIGGGKEDLPRDLFVQDDGCILVVGTAESSSGYWSAIARFTPTGANDTSFSTDGMQANSINIDGVVGSVPWGVAEASGGQIFVAGEGAALTGHELIIINYDPDGTYQGEFHRAYTNPGGVPAMESRGLAISILRDSDPSYYGDRMFVAGETMDPTVFQGTRDAAVFCMDGTLNPCSDFGFQGWVLIDFSDNGIFGIGDTDDSGHNIFYNSSSGGLSIIASATDRDSNPMTFGAVARINPDTGALETGPGYSGYLYYGDLNGHANQVAGTVDSDGKILIATDIYHNDTYREDILAGRLLGAGILADDFEEGNLDTWSSFFPFP